MPIDPLLFVSSPGFIKTLSPFSNRIFGTSLISSTVAAPARRGLKDIRVELVKEPTPWTKLRGVGRTGPCIALVEIISDD
jgi:hypothetical protein